MTAKLEDGSDEQAGQTSRRDMLKRTATATAAMGVVGTAATGNASAKSTEDYCPDCGPEDCEADECEKTAVACFGISPLCEDTGIDCGCEPANVGGNGFY